MADALLIMLVVGFFAVAAALVGACERLLEGADHPAPSDVGEATEAEVAA